jgi:predicted GH43/DUF377 family glycosyl hydrolase|tara:strand:+ start:246 stop:617 length:372 start_codon:yes stop_codon:yes gene_type:complete
MKIDSKIQNAQNAHLVDKCVVEGINKRNKNMSKISNTAFRASLMASGLDSDTIDKIVGNAVEAGKVSGTSRGKIDVLVATSERFRAVKRELEMIMLEEGEMLDEALVKAGHPPIKKLSINVAK